MREFRRTWAARVLPLGLVLAAAAGLITEVLQVHLDQFTVLLDHQSLLQKNRRPPSLRRLSIQVQLKHAGTQNVHLRTKSLKQAGWSGAPSTCEEGNSSEGFFS